MYREKTWEIPFDLALLRLSHCLTEAEVWAERGNFRKAGQFFHLAESYALRSGYLELLSLVWSYDDCLAPVLPPSA